MQKWIALLLACLLLAGCAPAPQAPEETTVPTVPEYNTMTAEEIKAFSEISSLNFNAAKIVVAMIPVLVIYPILQKYFVSGLVMGAVKE